MRETCVPPTRLTPFCTHHHSSEAWETFMDILMKERFIPQLSAMHEGNFGPPPSLEVLDVLGKGTYATIFAAIDRITQKEVAVKRLHHKGDNCRRIYNEIRANELVGGVTGVCPYYGHRSFQKITCLVFEKIDGIDLYSLMEQRNFQPLPERKVRKIASIVGGALSECHRRGVSHRDVKLENIMVDVNDNIFLIDFGLASFFQSYEGEEAPTDDICGSIETPQYMAPECTQDKFVRGTETDSWALGITLFALIFGAFPYSLNEMMSLFEGRDVVPLPPDDDKVTVSKDFRCRLQRLLSVDPSKRAGVEIMM
ncbi:NUAK family SNF1-like kinase 1-like [Planoprotostelium fungivorum]|uniref:NUAK family SNF1-like kinase 1-like n=1 Tax=Planoprotostelium fungivorum TaxID=1890364 RepID=A0A2P6NKA9_9EUKA|nr:NUAK family SNF1-like kinase 1-like [Planoprotostelium fungivorum]